MAVARQGTKTYADFIVLVLSTFGLVLSTFGVGPVYFWAGPVFFGTFRGLVLTGRIGQALPLYHQDS